MDTLDIALRFGAASLAGVALGLNRDLHGKPTGVRTLGLVGIGSALAVLSISGGPSADVSRVIQGILTGIGFLGVGVIVRNNEGQHVHGLTTAACVWLTACFGVACAVAEWRIVLIGALFVFIILVFGGRFEKVIHRHWPKSGTTDAG
jgi:putative Mg2+ transporter-C (MgtC) family protein